MITICLVLLPNTVVAAATAATAPSFSKTLYSLLSLEMLLNLIRVLANAKGREEFKRARRN